jgi:hypothetical protein
MEVPDLIIRPSNNIQKCCEKMKYNAKSLQNSVNNFLLLTKQKFENFNIAKFTMEDSINEI